MESIPKTSINEPKPFQFSLRTLLIGVTIFCVLLGLLVPAVRSARESANRVQLGYNFKQLGLGMHMYSDAHNQLPAACDVDSSGNPTTSWRVWMGVFMEGSKTEWDSNAAWDDPINAPYRTYFEPHFCNIPGNNPANPPEVKMLAITGPGTAFEAGKTYK